MSSHREPGKSTKKHVGSSKWFLGLTWVVFTMYSAAVIYWMFIGFGRHIHTGGTLHYNLVPLRTVRLFLDFGNGVSLMDRSVNLIGNVIVFIPFGFMLPLIQVRLFSWFRLTFRAAYIVLLLEILQMLLQVGSFDIDDLLLNLIGVWIGYGLLRLTSKMN